MLVIGDTHGQYDKYCRIIADSEEDTSIQAGDFSMNKTHWLDHENYLDSSKHRVLRGNHDPQLFAAKRKFDLGDYGEFNGAFYIRGAQSVSRPQKSKGIKWYEEEELTEKEGVMALEAYAKAKPEIMITHDCPWEIAHALFNISIKTRTNVLLQQAFEIHQPDLWIYGHHHKSVTKTANGTLFQCLGILDSTVI